MRLEKISRFLGQFLEYFRNEVGIVNRRQEGKLDDLSKSLLI